MADCRVYNRFFMLFAIFKDNAISLKLTFIHNSHTKKLPFPASVLGINFYDCEWQINMNFCQFECFVLYNLDSLTT